MSSRHEVDPKQELCNEFRQMALDYDIWPRRKIGARHHVTRWDLVKDPSWARKVALELHGKSHWMGGRSLEELTDIFAQAAARKGLTWTPMSNAPVPPKVTARVRLVSDSQRTLR